jgi:PAS domain S-box-containing protein
MPATDIRLPTDEFRDLVWDAPIGIVRTTPDGRFLFANPAFARLLGYDSPDDVLHLNARETFADPTERDRQLPEVLAGAERHTIAARRRDGTTVVLESHVRIIRDPDGRPEYFEACIVEVADRVRDEAAFRQTADQLVQAESKYRAMFEHAVAGMFQTSPEGRFLAANPALARMLGYDSPDDLLRDRQDLEHHHYVEPGKRAEFRQKLETHGIIRGFEYEAFRKDGSIVWLRDHVRAVRDAAGVVLYYEGTVADITERRRNEAARQHLLARAITAQEDERRRVARELHDETGQALSAILIGLRTVEEAPTLEDARSLANRLRRLAADAVRDVGRIARGLRPSILDDLGLSAALHRLAEEVTETTGVQVKVSRTSHARLAPAIETTLYRIIQEALTNVVRHASARTADVTLFRDARVVRAVVQDDGSGFEVPVAFTASERQRTLGLVGMQERAALLGGTVTIASRPGGGTTVSVTLPMS